VSFLGKSKPSLRREYIKRRLLETGRIPSSKELSDKFGVSPRQINRDIKTVVEELTDPSLIDEIRRKFLFELNRRLSDMEDRDFVKLTKHFIPEKSEVKAEGDLKFVLETWRPEKEGEDAESQN